jgi:4-hydroxy-tetrahydrodipicolinate synthase
LPATTRKKCWPIWKATRWKKPWLFFRQARITTSRRRKAFTSITKPWPRATPKPIILYNVPARTGSNILPATAVRLAKDYETICGMKEASGDVAQCMQLLKTKPRDFFVTSGDDQLALPLIACGMDGVISVAANCFPKDFSDMVAAAISNDYHLARIFHYNLLEGFSLLFTENNPAGVKAFLSEMGIIQNYLRLPLVPLSPALLEKVKAFLPSLK